MDTKEKVYDFVPLAEKRSYIKTDILQYKGYIDAEITCDTAIHMGSGYKELDNESNLLVYKTIRYDGKPIIPGSSLKGVVRQIAEAASCSCAKDLKKCGICIACDMFGSMGRASNVIFSDFISDNAVTEIFDLNQQFEPKNKVSDYYKFYKVNDSSYKNEKNITNQSVQVEVVSSGTVFKGRIHFKKLTEEQLSLLMYSLGLNEKNNEKINLKIGGFKNSDIGEVYVTVTNFNVNALNKTPAVLAENYVNMATSNKSGIAKINKILNVNNS